MSAFTELGVMPELAQAIQKLEWNLPTEIQSEAIPLILGGGDVLMASETGSGKTGAFCIPIVQVVSEHILAHQSEESQKSTTNKPKGPADNDWHLSATDRAKDAVLSQDLLTIQSKSGSWQGCRANRGIKSSKGRAGHQTTVYYEIHFAEQGLARIGWSLRSSSLDLGTDRGGWGYGGTAKKSNNRQFLDYGKPFGEKFDIVGCLLNLTDGELRFTKNGRDMGSAFKLPVSLLESRGFYPTVCVKNAGCRVVFGPTTGTNDYKPAHCTWTSELDSSLVVEGSENTAETIFSDAPLAIILEPSRELGKQTLDCIETFSKELGIKSSLWIGGTENKLCDSKSHIIVCTPGRLSEAVSKDQLELSNIHFFIIDEADALLQQGQHRLIKLVHSRLPKMFTSGRRLQTIFCSATLHNFEVRKLASELMYFPTWVDLKGEDSVPDTVHHVVLRIDPTRDSVYKTLQGLFETDAVHARDNVDRALSDPTRAIIRPEEFSQAIKLMKFYYTLKAIETIDMDQGIIFCRTKLDCDNLHKFMNEMNTHSDSNRYSNVRLHSSLSSQERVRNLDGFKDGTFKFLICTDVAARGIDVKGVPYVIQVTLPDEKSNYLHRIGRVGRAERMGLAVSLVATKPEKVWYHKCNKRECYNTRAIEEGGCCDWFDEMRVLAEIEDHLNITIQEIEQDFKIQTSEFDGRVVYGSKLLQQSSTYEGHVEQLKSLVDHLTGLESKAQLNYLKMYC